MTVEAITKALYEYMHEEINDLPETEDEKAIRYLDKRKTRSTKESTDNPANVKKLDCNRCGAPNWSRQHECPATHMTDKEVDRAIEDAKCADQEFLIRYEIGKVFTDNNTNLKVLEEVNLENSELDLANNLSSKIEVETDVNTERKEKTVRRSKGLTKTNPVVRYNNPVCHDYKKHRKKTELGDPTGSIRNRIGGGGQQLIYRLPNQIQTLLPIRNRGNQNSKERLTVHHILDRWRNERHEGKPSVPIGRKYSSAKGRRGNVEDRRTHLDCRN